MHMLGQPHAIDADDVGGFDIDLGGLLQRRAGEAGFPFDVGPFGGAEAGGESIESLRVPVDEILVEHMLIAAAPVVLGGQHQLAQTH